MISIVSPWYPIVSPWYQHFWRVKSPFLMIKSQCLMAKSHHPKSVDVFFSPPCTKNPPAVPTKSWQPAIGQHPNRPQWLPALEDRLRAKCGKIMGERGKTGNTWEPKLRIMAKYGKITMCKSSLGWKIMGWRCITTVQKYYTKAAVQQTNAPQNQACKWKCYWIMLFASIWFSEVDSTWQIKILTGTITTGNSGSSN